MYNLPYFKENDPKDVMEFIHNHPFAFIAGCNQDQQPVATQIPVFIEERDHQLFLSGHMMKQQDHHKAFEQNPNVLCVFTGNSSYVSATWYKDPQQASTWNYMSVHVKGVIKFLDDAALIDVLKKTSLHFEKGDQHSTTVYDNLPVDYREKLLKAIVAFEVKVQSIDHVFKLSQNRDKESYHSIISKLEKGDDGGRFIAEEMRKREDRRGGGE
ncbi:MAG: FMN-binding negative transcriptional regulator [Flavisolibacter sp.]|jgi:transcriptional regulator|nr:FMN-binding negative transcriptional regulator [Flavisolibacter sp.]